MDLGSMVATIIIASEIVLTVVLLVNEVRAWRSECKAIERHTANATPRTERVNVRKSDNTKIVRSIEDDRMLEIVVRANDAIVANIDAINLGALAIVALPAAFGVFAIDKLDETGMLGLIALLLLSASIFNGLRAFNWGYDARAGNSVRDSLDCRRFLAYYSQAGDRAIADTIRAIIETSTTNAAIRAKKKTLSRNAIAFFVGGLVLMGASKLSVPPDEDGKASKQSPPVTCTLKVADVGRPSVITCR